ncbi:hypothetical protein LOK49_LG12G02039 [Camellia lanceoleosa]|uniref:Uncharacterized protein n=1 Tax=Camellia lanceoleosa TaxID=1840588 RepID=A0ACC0FRR4_9ERIC|nr:hypothetical protein LOK49_LG12G02039 [Camellia lanceoleosa]
MGSNDERCSDNFDLGLDVSPKEDYELRSIIIDDDKDKFVSRINRHKYKADVVPLVHWEWIFEYGALKCAAALLQGETSQTADFYSSDTFRLPMTHTLARTDNYDFIELFIRHGASFDHRCYGVGQSLWYLEGKLPLNTAVESISYGTPTIFIIYLSPFKAFFVCVCGQSSVFQKRQMDSIRVLVLNTKEAELEICHYAKEGNVVELAVLLMTAREQVALLMSQIRDGSTSNGCISVGSTNLSRPERRLGEVDSGLLTVLSVPYIKEKEEEINIFPTGWTFMARSFHTIRAASASALLHFLSAAEVGDGDEVMQPVTTNAAIG